MRSVKEARPGRRGQRTLAVAVALIGCCALEVVAAAAAGPPERIVSKRIRILPAERYRELRDEWKEYTKEHPGDPLGWTQLAKAARYAGDDCTEAAAHARRAIQIAPDYADAHAALVYACCELYCAGCGMDMKESARELEKALELDPSDAEPNFTLWVMRLSQGDLAGSEECLRALLSGGQIPEPVLDFGYNLLIGLEPNAILITNGDNDTYPPLALQAGRGLRPDVAVVNLSLLNTRWYRERLREGPLRVPIPLLDEKVPMPQAPPAVKGLVEALAADGWKRPLYVAVTVPEGAIPIPNGLSLEGLAYRVLAEPAGEPKVDLGKLEANLHGRYRLEAATSLGFDWEAYSAVRRLIPNYAGIYARLAKAQADSGRNDEAARAMDAALQLCEFHKNTEMGRKLVEGWLEWDPSSAAAARWKKNFDR